MDNDTAQAPAWRVGQWWSWRLETQAYDEEAEVATVVLSDDGPTYSVGTPDPDAAAHVYPFHLIPIGDIDRSNLAWQAHGLPVEFLRFPLEDNATWTTDMWAFQGAEVVVRQANVTGPSGPHDGFRIDMSYPGGGGLIASADWSPAEAQFVRVSSYFGGPEPFASAILLDSGDNADGTAFPFVASDLLRYNANAGEPESMTAESFEVDAASDLVILACFLSGSPGVYRVAMVPADGQAGTCEAVNQAAGGTRYQVVVREAAAGTGHVVGTSLGQGGSNVELFQVDTGDA
jgi:hypothetical protein